MFKILFFVPGLIHEVVLICQFVFVLTEAKKLREIGIY